MTPANAPSRRTRAFTLIEATLSTVVVGIMMAAALVAVEKTARLRGNTQDRQIAMGIAQELMSEILAREYAEPDSISTALGREAGEATVSSLDDVDDYDDWLESPPRRRNGLNLSNRSNWYTLVDVRYVHPYSPETVTSSASGCKRITVEVGTVTAGGSPNNAANRKPLVTLYGLAGLGR